MHDSNSSNFECSKWRTTLMATLKQLKTEMVIFGSAEIYNFTAGQWTQGTERVLRQISQSTNKAYVIRATPGRPFDGTQCLAAPKILAAEKINDTNCSATNLHSQCFIESLSRELELEINAAE